MFRTVSVLISALLCTPSYTALDVSVTHHIVKSSVLLRMKTAPDAKGHRGFGGCSGTYIDPTHILTAAHCISADTQFVWAKGPQDIAGYPVHVVRLAYSHDLALLEAPYKSRNYVKLAAMPVQGDTVINVGSPLDFEYVISAGLVGALNYRVRGFKARYLVTTAMINPGSSGGGAFNTKGELIGVNTMMVGMFGWTGISLAVSVDDVRAFVK